MRWLTRARRDEEGAVIVLMVASVVVIVGMAALVIDVGAIRDEKRQLQNAADAGALAVAQSCALRACVPACPAAPCLDEMTSDLVNANSRDGSSTVASIVYPPDVPKSVKVATMTNSGGTAILPYNFGQVLTGVKGTTVNAAATASWGPAGRATVVRLAISQCDVTRLGIDTVSSAIKFQGGSSCTSGRDNSGAFGWLDREPATLCELTLSAGGMPKVDPGASEPTECLAPYLRKDILLPVFDDVIGISGSGGNAFYTIRGFARFHLTGYSFPGRTSDPAPSGCGGSNCITGYFVRYVAPSQVVGGVDFGVSVVKLVS